MTRATLRVPHFVGIGAPRCGTTWVFKMLRLHPRVWMPWKEIHYFDSVDSGTDSGFRIQDRAFRLKRGWLYGLRRLAASGVPGSRAVARRWFPLHAVNAPGFAWTARYFLGEASLAWYAGLFAEGDRAGMRCGEITPAYFMLSPRGIDEFAAALPDARLILMLRDPVAWAWSDACKRLRAVGRRPTDLSDDELINACAVPTGRSRADFGANVARWTDRIPRERLFVGYHDEIRESPALLLDRLCDFIGVDRFSASLRSLPARRVNSSARGLPMPPAVERHIAERYREEARIMAERVGGYAEHWLARIDKVLVRR